MAAVLAIPPSNVVLLKLPKTAGGASSGTYVARSRTELRLAVGRLQALMRS